MARYCSVWCQRDDWAEHKPSCVRDDRAVKRTCLYCGGHPADPNKNCLKCGNCRVARYCSAACQHADWATHRRVCVEVKSDDDGEEEDA